MKYALYPEKQGTITADSEDANYPATNLTDNYYRKKVWKAVASVQTATLTVPISAGSSGIGIFNTNAVSGTITIADGGTPVLGATAITISHGRYWQEYTYYAGSCVATIELTTTATTLEAGIVRAAKLYEIGNPLASGMSEGEDDHSVKIQLRNGGFYVIPLEVVRTFSYSMLLDRDAEYRDLMTLYNAYKGEPFAMLITDNTDDDHQWAVFGCMERPPRANHSTPTHSNVSVDIKEGV